MERFKGPYVNGCFIERKRKGGLQKCDPGKTIRTIGVWYETKGAVKPAVAAAQQAFDNWAWLKESERLYYLRTLQAVFTKRRDQLAESISSEMGKILPESQAEVQAAIDKFDTLLTEGLGLLASHKSTQNNYYAYHPRGVMVILGPFNFPLHLPNGNWIAALATGNTVVFKPSELTPFTGQLIAECFHEAGFPKGVFNLVQGGATVGQSLVKHPDVKGVIFVGSDRTGQEIKKQVEHDPKKICILEMGGKNAAVIFDDADLEKAITACTASMLTTTGQRCNALSRIIVHESMVTQLTVELANRTLSWHPGYYKQADAMIGPLVSKAAMTNFFNYQELAIKAGARAVLTPFRISMSPEGYYVTPTIHRLDWQGPSKDQIGYRYDEIFAPDVAIYSFKKPEEAIQIHNDCRYGLVASVFTKDKIRFEEMFRYLEVGNLYWNRGTIGSSPTLPFGGVKASGNDHPAGLFSPLFCTYPVAIQS